jgi:hypothetical protein
MVGMESAEARARLRLRVAQLEADLAYFQARLGLLGEPVTLNQVAQVRTFNILARVIGHQTAKLKERGG